MIVVINRYRCDEEGTYGTLLICGGKYWACHTLELPWRNNEPNVSCIPHGQYECIKTFSPKFDRMTYEVQNVSGRSAIRIHPGNTINDIAGCILLGDQLVMQEGLDKILQSRKAVDEFENQMSDWNFTLRINDLT